MPLAHWRTYRERIQQKRKALRMLALSGVVRPSDIELRYYLPMLKAGSLNHFPCAMPTAAAQQCAPLKESAAAVKAQRNQFLQWLRQTGSLSRRLLNPWAETVEG